MVQLRSKLVSADNTGARDLAVITNLGGYKKHYAQLGDIVRVVVKEATPHSSVKKSEMHHAVIVRQKKEYRRADGSYIRFDDNAAVIIDPKSKEPKGTRIFGPVARELKTKGFSKLISLAPEVL